MLYINSADGYSGDFGSAATVSFFYDVATENKLEHLLFFLDNGYTADANLVADEVQSMDWPESDGYDEVAGYVIAALRRCSNNIAILVG